MHRPPNAGDWFTLGIVAGVAYGWLNSLPGAALLVLGWAVVLALNVCCRARTHWPLYAAAVRWLARRWHLSDPP